MDARNFDFDDERLGHTKEPWSIKESSEPYEDIVIRSKDQARIIASLSIDDAPVEDYNREQKHNARRIVACVNFCEGLSTENIEHDTLESSIKKVLERMKNKCDDATAQRDELLAAMKELASGGDNVCGFEIPCTCRFCRARALITKIEAQS